MVQKLRIGPGPRKLLGPPPPEPPIPPVEPPPPPEEWEKKAAEHIELAQQGQTQLRDLTRQLELVRQPMSGPFKLLKAFTESLLEPIPPSPEDVARFKVPSDIKEQVITVQFAMERDDFFARLYGQVPYIIAGDKSTDPEEILTMLRPPPNMTPEELDEVHSIVSGMVDTLTGIPTLPEMAAEAEPVVLPDLTVPTDITAPPTTINTLTVAAIIKALTAPVVPPSIMTEEEWTNFMIESGQISDKADLDSVEFMQREADRILAEWEERNNMLESFRTGIAEMPDYQIVDWLKEMVVMPGLGLLEAANFYFEHVSMPLAGAIYGGYIPDIDVAYQRYRKTETEWQALAHAWEDWDAPGEGAWEWILKYMLMEGLVDPLTYLGWGIATRLTKPLGLLGRGVGAIERGAMTAFEIPFNLMRATPDAIAGLAQRIAGRPVTGMPRTIGQQATIAMHTTSRYVDKYMTGRFGKALYQLTMNDWRAGTTTAVKYALRHPMAQNDVALAGRQFLKHAPVTEKEVIEWASRLGTTLTPEQITKQTVDSVDRIFEDYFSKVGGNKKLITNREAGDELVRTLYGSLSDDTSVIAGKILLQRSRQIINGAHSFGQLSNPFKAMRQLMNRNYKTWIKTAESMVALNQKEMGTVLTFLDDVPIRVQKAWQNGIDRWIVRPFAQSYLTFAMYGPMNVIEDIIRTGLGGESPGTKTAQSFARKWAGTSYDPDLMRGSWSETMGALAERPAAEQNNWILQLAGLGQKGWGDRIYDLLVIKPGHIGIGMRRNFVDRKATHILKDLGGDTFARLAKVGPSELTGVANKKIAREVQQVATQLKGQGLPDALRAAKGDFTRAKIIRREVDNIMKEHPDLPRPVRDHLMREYDDGALFREVPAIKLAKEVELIPVTTEVGQGYDLVFKGEKVGLVTYGTTEGLGVEGIMIGTIDVSPVARRQGVATTALGRILKEAEATGKPLFSGVLEPDGVRWLEGLKRKGIIKLEPHEQTMFGDVITRGKKPFPGDAPVRAGDSIDITMRESNTIMMDDFIASPERASTQYEQLADMLTQLEVRNPQEMAQLIHSLNFMSSMYGATPKQILGRAVTRTRGLPFADRRLSIDKALDSITIFRERAGASMDKVMDRIKAQMSTIYADNPVYISKAESLFNLQTAKRMRGSELGEEISAWRHEFFAEAKPADLHTNDFWDNFDREVLGRHHEANVEMARYDGQIKNAIDDLDVAGGLKARQRPAIRIRDRELAPNDVALLIGARGDDVSRSILDVATAQNDRDMFVEFVMAQVKDGDLGFSRESVGTVFDQISYSLQVDPKNMSWVTGKQIELEAVRRDLHGLYNGKMLPDEEIASIGKYFDDTAQAVQKEMFAPPVGKKPPVIKEEYKNYQSLRQQAMDESHTWYYKEFTNYSNANMFDAMMKSIYPFWTYESQRWYWLPRSFVRHPGTFTAFERWQDNTDYGYIHIPGTSVDINPFRGTIYGTLSTRLAKRDFPEYYDSLGIAGKAIGFSDFLSRYGFYPGAHIGVPLAIFGGMEMQFGEALPAIFKTPLDFLIGTYPDNESVKWISERLFGDRFRNYMTMLTVSRMGGDASLIFSKQKEGEALTPEEQQMWDDARREIAFYSAGFEQFGLFRMRTDEQYKMYEEASKVIEEMIGYTQDQQDWLRKHGYRIWDMVGGMSPSEQAVLQEMDYYRWVGNVRPLLPGRQQEILNKIELGWNRVAEYGETVMQKKLDIQRDFLTAARGPDNYNAVLLETYDDHRKFIDAEIEQYPLMDINNRADYYKKYNIAQPVLHPFRELLNLYYSIELKEITDPETGEKVRDWDNFWAHRQAIEDAIPEDYQREWDDFLSRNSTRIEEVRRDVFHNYFRIYNKTWESILTSYNDEEQALIEEYLHLERTGQQLDRQEEIKATKSEKTGDMLISSFRREVSGAKKALRYHNPLLDAWLYYWGRTTSFTSPTGEDVYRELAKQTGRTI